MARTGTSPEIRILAITRYLSGDPIDRLIEDYGESKSSIYRWTREWEEKGGQSTQVMRNQMVTAKQYYNLDQKAQKLEQMVTFLRVIHCTAGDSLEEKLAEVERMYYEGDFSVHVMCEALDVPRGTFYNHIKRNKRNSSSYETRRENLRNELIAIYKAHIERYPNCVDTYQWLIGQLIADHRLAETVALLSRQKVKEHIYIDVNVADLPKTTRTTATYPEIKAYIKDKYGLCVSSLNIAQIKEKHGFEKRENYNKGKEGHRVPKCPPEKEKAIEDAFKHFGML